MSQRPYREVTVSSIVFGVVVGALMNASITYAGLKIGFTIGGSAIAAVLGFGVLRGILRQGTILETNIGQTVASAVNIPNSGIIFTVPVLYLLGFPLSASHPDFWLILLACVAGAVLGAVFIIPLRKQMIDIERLRFPTGTAVAAILKSPGAGSRKSLVLLAGALVAGLIYLPAGLPTIKFDRGTDAERSLWGYSNLDWRLAVDETPPEDAAERADWEERQGRADRDGDGRPDLVLTDDSLDVGRLFGFPDYLLFVFAIAPFAFGAGYITGGAGLMVLAGGVLAYWVINPAAFLMGYMPADTLADQVPGYARNAFNRPLGIGMLLGGAIMGVLYSLPALKAALKSVAAAARVKGESQELGLGVLAVAALIGFLVLFGACDYMLHAYPSGAEPATQLQSQEAPPAAASGGLLSGWNPHLQSLVVATVGTLWIWFAGIIIAQCTGMTDWSPISGMALLTVVLMMALLGPQSVLASVLLGATLCVAVTCAADMMQDLKTGHLVGSIPRRQQIVELIASGLGPLISMATILLIVAVNMKAVGKPLGPGTDTVAPQAQALQAVIQGVQGGQLPYALYGCGAVIGVVLGLGAFPGLGVLVGLSMYLPFQYILPYGVGCLANLAVRKVKGTAWAEEWGVPFCAGLIVGEGVVALIISLVALMV